MSHQSRTSLALIVAAILTIIVVVGGNPLRVFQDNDLKTLQADILLRAHSDFTDVNDKMQKEYGFVFKAGAKGVSCYDSRDPLENSNPDSCNLSNPAEPVTADDRFIRHWRQTSPALESWLLQRGWRKTWNDKQPIAEILDAPQNNGSIGVNYIRTQNRIECRLSFMRVQPHTPSQLNATEECYGDLDGT